MVLVGHHANPNARDDRRQTPLHAAAEGTEREGERFRIVKMLIAKGADRKALTRPRSSPSTTRARPSSRKRSRRRPQGRSARQRRRRIDDDDAIVLEGRRLVLAEAAAALLGVGGERLDLALREGGPRVRLGTVRTSALLLYVSVEATTLPASSIASIRASPTEGVAARVLQPPDDVRPGGAVARLPLALVLASTSASAENATAPAEARAAARQDARAAHPVGHG